jgi:hypothetical protein
MRRSILSIVGLLGVACSQHDGANAGSPIVSPPCFEREGCAPLDAHAADTDAAVHRQWSLLNMLVARRFAVVGSPADVPKYDRIIRTVLMEFCRFETWGPSGERAR